MQLDIIFKDLILFEREGYREIGREGGREGRRGKEEGVGEKERKKEKKDTERLNSTHWFILKMATTVGELGTGQAKASSQEPAALSRSPRSV